MKMCTKDISFKEIQWDIFRIVLLGLFVQNDVQGEILYIYKKNQDNKVDMAWYGSYID